VATLRSRLKHHLRDRHQESWDRFSVYLTLGDKHLRELEALILRIVQPSGNKQKGKFPHSEDIRPKFTRNVRQSQRELTGAVKGSTTLRPLPGQRASEGRADVLGI